MKLVPTACLFALVLSACETIPPNTPGAGVGDTYTPVIDLEGIDMSRYSIDLSGCRAYAKQINAARAEQQGMWGGILAGALIGAAVGGNQNYAEQGALAGGLSGMGAAGVKARNKQELILANCMAGRGYRVLEGATQPTASNVPSPYVSAAPSSPVAAAVTPEAVAPVTSSPAPAPAPAPSRRLPRGVTSCLGCQ